MFSQIANTRRRKVVLALLSLLIISSISFFVYWKQTHHSRRDLVQQLKEKGYTVKEHGPVYTNNFPSDLKKDALYMSGFQSAGLYGLNVPRDLTAEQLQQDVHIFNQLKLPISLGFHNCEQLNNLDSLTGMNNLHGLGIDDCPNITNINAISSSSALQRISLSNCPQLNNLDSLKSLTEIRFIQITNLDLITNVDFAKNLNKLRELYLYDGKNIENLDGLQGLNNLRNVIIQNHKVPEEELNHLSNTLPQLQINPK